MSENAQTLGVYPEKRKGELFVGNHTDAESLAHLSELKTLRLAKPALSLDGEECPGMSAMFIHESDSAAHDRIMTGRLSAIRAGRKITP